MAQSQVLPKELRLTAAPTMPQARSYLFKQKSTQSKYTSGQTIQINIPRLQRTYLTKDSYLKFNVDLALTAGGFGGGATTTTLPGLLVALDTCGAYGLFDKIEVYDYLGSTLLESISGHGQLMALLNDTSHGMDEMSSRDQSTLGYGQSYSVVDSSAAGYAQTAGIAYTRRLVPPVSGAAFLPSNTAVTGGTWYSAGAVTITKEFAIPVASFLGLLSQKYAPLHNGYTIQLTLNPFSQAFISGKTTATGTGTVAQAGFTDAATNISVSEVYFASQALELGPMAESMLLSSTSGQPMIVPSRTYRNFNGLTTAGQTSYRLDLNLNVASMTSLLWIMRDNTNYTSASYNTLGQRIKNYLQNWNFQYGSSILPQTTGITSTSTAAGSAAYTEAYIELLKARRNWFGNRYSGCILNSDNFNKDIATVTAGNMIPKSDNSVDAELGRFAAGLNLELVPGKEIICGLNTNGMNTSINMTFAANTIASRVDAWCEFDSFINITPGLATTVSF